MAPLGAPAAPWRVPCAEGVVINTPWRCEAEGMLPIMPGSSGKNSICETDFFVELVHLLNSPLPLVQCYLMIQPMMGKLPSSTGHNI